MSGQIQILTVERLHRHTHDGPYRPVHVLQILLCVRGKDNLFLVNFPRSLHHVDGMVADTLKIADTVE